MSDLRVASNPSRAYDVKTVAEILQSDGTFGALSPKLKEIEATNNSLKSYFKAHGRDPQIEQLRDLGARISPLEKGKTLKDIDLGKTRHDISQEKGL